MRRVANFIQRCDDESGASMVEYGFLLVGIALVVVIAAEVLGLSVSEALLLPMAWL